VTSPLSNPSKDLETNLIPATEDAKQEVKLRPFFAAVCMFCAVCFYATNLLIVKVIGILEPGLSSFWLLSIRSMGVIVILTTLLKI